MNATPVSLGHRKMSALDGRFSLALGKTAPIMTQAGWSSDAHGGETLGHGTCCNWMISSGEVEHLADIELVRGRLELRLMRLNCARADF
jgi:hypothetical protein